LKDLSAYAGIEMSLERPGRLVFGGDLEPVQPDIRTLEQARGVLWNMTAAGPGELYYMYRGVSRQADREMFERQRIRYDITVILPGTISGEYVKTVGHYHPAAEGTEVQYPEVYEVMSGKAHYLLQKPGADPLTISDVVIVEASPGDKVLIPPGYGHVTMNPGDEPLVMANLIEREFRSVYEPFSASHGAAYYELLEKDMPVFVENEHYKEVAEPRLVEPRDLQEFGLVKGTPLYVAFVKRPEAFDYLVKPHLFAEALDAALA
jgi:glucose-6-phosphate isomerase